MMELLVMEQFLGILLHKLQPRVVAEQPTSCKKAAFLVEDLTKALAEPGGPARASEDVEPSKTQAPPRPVSDQPALGFYNEALAATHG
ncbi:zinc finger and SCAN domain-containing protein 18 [Balaenoptera acutorostrata]|uniref:Zinc finger and SCAN domain-containing protein 18 n=1 Tax=Balaenoptera acutorostrata TaxID=9767 RepID=A0ABM3SL14_BALAC|nr:zinc finger and SCAN domain-containing protein 18 [Balaenoptera acutorostrata]